LFIYLKFLFIYSIINNSVMKIKLFILFFVLCSLVNGLEAQTYPTCPNPNEWVEIILVFPSRTDSIAIKNLKESLYAYEEGYIPNIDAHLWRVCKGDYNVGTSSAYTINSASGLIGHIGNGASSISIESNKIYTSIWPPLSNLKLTGVDSNHVVSIIPKINDTVTTVSKPFGYETPLLPEAYERINREFANIHVIPSRTGKPISIYVLDSGNKNGRDGTGNALIDFYLDVNKGQCFITNTNDPRQNKDSTYIYTVGGDPIGPLVGARHGTNVISIIANTLSKFLGTAEILKGSITSIKVLNAQGKGSCWEYLQGFARALGSHAQVINSSVIIKSQRTSSLFGAPIDVAIKYAELNGTMVVTGSGNDTTEIPHTEKRFLPADTTNNYLITVAASNAVDSISRFSNWGRTNGLMAAPGTGVYAMNLSGNISLVTGTSYSTPFVTAAYAILKYISPNSSATSLKSIIFQTANSTLNPGERPTDYGILNILAATKMLRCSLCSAPRILSVSRTATTATITWTSVASARQGYILQYKATTATATAWADLPNTAATGYDLTGLSPSTEYYVRVKTDCSDFPTDGINSVESNQEVFRTLAVTLPLELVYFTAFVTKEREIGLTWATQNEMNIAHFDIQRSANGKDWQTLGTAKAFNTSGRHVYTFNDPNKDNTEGVLYYRIRIVGTDETETFSLVKSVNFGGKKGEISLYPNPTHEGIYINNASDGEAKVEITDIFGRIVLIKELKITNRQAYLPFENRLNSRGVYALRLFQNNKIMDVKPFVVD
jgi:Subtilase family/Fibronectin type III domain/Secretion system C-terminal sorting domain